jgi:lactoylglutathione lyase
VDALTQKLVDAGYPLLSPCRVTGDGYYESVIGDPEGNRIEITI